MKYKKGDEEHVCVTLWMCDRVRMFILLRLQLVQLAFKQMSYLMKCKTNIVIHSQSVALIIHQFARDKEK